MIPKAIPFLLALLVGTTAFADARRTALRSFDEAIDAVHDDRGRDCRRTVLRDLRDSRDATRAAREKRQVERVANWLATLSRDAGEVCETITVRRIRRVQRDVEDFADEIERATKPESSRPQAMSPAEFNALLSAVKKASFSDDKIAVIEAALASAYINVSQLAPLLKEISFDDDRLTCVRKVWRRVVDRKKNGYKIASSFSFSDSGKEAVGILTQ